MNSKDYEPLKEYEISGIKVRSEVVKDEPLPDDQDRRALLIRSSCESHRWGIRTQDHSYNCPANWPEFDRSFEEIRFQAAETVAKTELGKVAETAFRFLAAEVHGPTGKKITSAAVADLSRPPTLLGPDIIQALELQPTAHEYYEDSPTGFSVVPLFRARIIFGPHDVETDVAPSENGSPGCILGGDFFQSALRNRQDLVQELLMPDHYRTLANAARCKKKYVLIAGKYGEHRPRLERIKKALQNGDLHGLILDEYPDIEEQSLAEKMVTYASICRFVIVDDLEPSGHISELGICHERKFVTAVLRLQGKAATAMQADIEAEVSFIREFSYPADDDLENAVVEAARWADGAVQERARALNRKYNSWRGPQKIME